MHILISWKTFSTNFLECRWFHIETDFQLDEKSLSLHAEKWVKFLPKLLYSIYLMHLNFVVCIACTPVHPSVHAPRRYKLAQKQNCTTRCTHYFNATPLLFLPSTIFVSVKRNFQKNVLHRQRSRRRPNSFQQHWKWKFRVAGKWFYNLLHIRQFCCQKTGPILYILKSA